MKTVIRIPFFLVLLFAGRVGYAESTDSIRFFFIEQFFTPPKTLAQGVLDHDPAWAVARFLAGYSTVEASGTTVGAFACDPDPLRIPNPFVPAGRSSMDLSQRMTGCLERFGFSYEITYPEDFSSATQIAARQISRGFPVIALHPRPYLLFGFDYRETEPSWFVVRFSPADNIELITRSDWRAEWWLWEPDPRSVTLISVTGQNSAADAPEQPAAVMAKLLESARTDSTTGRISYIKPILQMIDSLTEAPEMPRIVTPPEDPADPLYFRRAQTQRLELQTYLESLVLRAQDTLVQQNLRLAMYSAGKAANEFALAAKALYGEPADSAPADPQSVLENIQRRWVEQHLNAADHLSEVVRWDHQTLASLKDVLAADKSFNK